MQNSNFGKTPDSIARLHYVRPGARPSAAQWNAMVDFVKGMGASFSAGQFQQQNGVLSVPATRRQGAWLRCKSDDDCGAFGIVEVYDGKLDQGDYYLRVRAVSSKAVGPQKLFAGCERYPLKAGCDGFVKIVGPYDAVKVRSDGPLTFMQGCSASFGEEQVKADVSAQFLAVGSSDLTYGSSVPNLTPIIQPACPYALVGKTTSAVLQGQFSKVTIWQPNNGVVVASASDLSDTGDTIQALFLFGAAPVANLWVGLDSAGWAWLAYTIECPGS